MSEPRENCERDSNSTTEDWRENMKNIANLQEQYQYMLDHDILTDCTFVVGPEDGETREFKAHRVFIARVSPVFEAMLLRGEMLEAKTGHVRVTDLSPNTFQLLLSSMYGKEPEMTNFQEAQDLTYAAHKYQMTALLEICITRMGTLIAPDNVWAAFETADLLQHESLKKRCVQVLQRDTLRCLNDPGFLQTSEENVALLLEQDELNVDDELLLMSLIVHWARNEALQRGLSDDDEGVRAVLKPRLLSLFRILAMSSEQFIICSALTGWFTREEKAAISKCRQSKDCSKMPQHLCTLAEKRKILTDIMAVMEPSEMLICKREIIGSPLNVCQPGKNYCKTEFDDRYYYYVHATLIFRVKSSCQWLGFQCASQSWKDPTQLLAKYPVYHDDIRARMYTFKHTLSTHLSKIQIGEKLCKREVEYNSSISVLFDKPIPLVTDNWFALEVIFRQSSNLLGHYLNPERARSVCTEAGVEFVFQTEMQDGYLNSVNEGLIEALLFSL